MIRTDNMVQKGNENVLNQKAGKADIEFVSSWDSDIRKLSQDNPGLNFKRAQFKKNFKFELKIVGFDKFPALNMVTGYMAAMEVAKNDVINTIANVPNDFKTNGDVNFFSVCPMSRENNGEVFAEPKDLKIIIKYNSIRN